jgi:hypothetical protein
MDTAHVIDQLRALGGRIDALSERVQQLTAEKTTQPHHPEHQAGERAHHLAKKQKAP